MYTVGVETERNPFADIEKDKDRSVADLRGVRGMQMSPPLGWT